MSGTSSTVFIHLGRSGEKTTGSTQRSAHCPLELSHLVLVNVKLISRLICLKTKIRPPRAELKRMIPNSYLTGHASPKTSNALLGHAAEVSENETKQKCSFPSKLSEAHRC
ncbi:hypothetical protein RRG08_038503 [Elysia crispata]|uniref:Uncharacterized protein n=1 Tax=Elysia crispata TaxID=231223 RepID=A0AAE1DYM6_9GAST|nr:hypothetical protein RRG08_038503 [Elysia crispata]